MLNEKEYLLDIEQAKKLNLLKEKDNRVRSYKEFVKKYSCSHGYSYNLTAEMITHSDTPIYTTDQLTQHEAKAIAAFSQLLKLRRDWIGDWEPKNEAYAIIYWKSIMVDWFDGEDECRSLSFPTAQMAKEFLETFHDLIEEAKILI